MLLLTLFWGCGETIKTADYSGYCQEDPEANLIEEDGDCDGILTVDDCDDSNADSTSIAEDGDCDGVLTAEDCDDSNADSTLVAEDADCDGILTADDCDDANAGSTLVAEDADCDGILTADDCDDADADSTAIAEDGDCDGVVTTEDCDDTDADSTIIAEDGDCDGVLTADDCDDLNDTLLAVANDGDCDGLLTEDDCNDADAGSTAIAEDMDCDGFVTDMDCNDTDASINPLATDEWYDGIDSDCAGNNDYDYDEDGDAREGDEYCTVVGFLTESDCTGAGGTWSMGYDCQDTNPNRRSLPNEEDPTACYKDSDGDGYGDRTLGSNQLAFGLTEGSDCDDTVATRYPGAAFNEDAPINEYCLDDADGDGYGAPADGECFDFTFSANMFGFGSVSYWPAGRQIQVMVDGELYETKTSAGSVCILEDYPFSFEYITSNFVTGSNHAATIEWTRSYSSTSCFFCYTDYLINLFTVSGGVAFNRLETDYESGFEVDSQYVGGSVIMNSNHTMYTDIAESGEQILGTDSDDSDAAVH